MVGTCAQVLVVMMAMPRAKPMDVIALDKSVVLDVQRKLAPINA